MFSLVTVYYFHHLTKPKIHSFRKCFCFFFWDCFVYCSQVLKYGQGAQQPGILRELYLPQGKPENSGNFGFLSVLILFIPS